MDYPFEPIGGGLSVAVHDSCRFSQDAVLLAKFAAPDLHDTVCDLGTGTGILPLLWCRRDPPAHITAVDREASFLDGLCIAVERHRLADRITPLLADWNDVDAMPPDGTMTLVTCNPPYFPCDGARPSPDPLRDAARREDTPQTLSLLCRAAARLLTKNGRFCLCHRPERLADVFASLTQAGLSVRRLQFVQTQDGTAPWLVLCEAGHGGVLRVLPTLVSGDKGTHTAAYTRLYR